MIDEKDPLLLAIGDHEGIITLHVLEYTPFVAMCQGRQFDQRLIVPVDYFDVAETGCIGGWQQVRAGFDGAAVVPVQRCVSALDPGLDLRRQVIGGFGQFMVTTKHPIGPPAWQSLANGGRPERVEGVRQMSEHATTTQPAAVESRPVNTEPGVPPACFIESDGLLVGFFMSAAQSPAA
ncbi:hypothetical protein D3C76_684420 [compost metagenome]